MTKPLSSIMNVDIDIMRVELEKLEMIKRITELQASLPPSHLLHLPRAISSSMQLIPTQSSRASPPPPSPPVLPSLLPSSSTAQLSEEPLLTGRHEGLSPEEAYHQLTQGQKCTKNLETIGMGKWG